MDGIGSGTLAGSQTRFTLTSSNVKAAYGQLVDGKKSVERVDRGKLSQSQSLANTQLSSWTPLNKPTSDQLFCQRKELVANWFDMWSGAQRRQFLDLMLRHCTRHQLAFVYAWFERRVPPLLHVDFTTVLPRFLSLHILSFLDPRSLCRAARVSWHWKFIADQDVLWKPKCVRYGWFLPYDPPLHEYGAWKHHYIACVNTLDLELSKRTVSTADTLKELLKQKRAEEALRKSRTKLLVQTKAQVNEILAIRPPWLPPDRTPRDLDPSRHALIADYDPSDPAVMNLLNSARGTNFASLFAFSVRRRPATGNEFVDSLRVIEDEISASRETEHRLIVRNSEDFSLTMTGRRPPLSASVLLESHEGRRLTELINMPAEPPLATAHSTQRRPDLSGGSQPSLALRYSSDHQSGCCSTVQISDDHPRVIFISSRVPAAEVLLDAVKFDVLPIVYEFEGTTLETLLHRLETSLRGRTARSIGIFTQYVFPWEIRLVQDAIVTVDNLDASPEFLNFFLVLSGHVLARSSGGHVDVFVPLHSCEPGTQLLGILEQLTAVEYTSPVGLVGNCNHVNSEWSSSPEVGVAIGNSGRSVPSLYFCETKLGVWSNVADRAVEACDTTRSVVGKYFDRHRRDVVSQLVGEMIFDIMCKASIHKIGQISSAIVDGLTHVGQQHNVRNPVYLLGQYLLQVSTADELAENPLITPLVNAKFSGGTLKPTMSLRPGTLARHLQLDEQFNGSLDSDLGNDHAVANGNSVNDYDDDEFEHSSEMERSSEIPEEVTDPEKGDDDGEEKSDRQKSGRNLPAGETDQTKKHVTLPHMNKSSAGPVTSKVAFGRTDMLGQSLNSGSPGGGGGVHSMLRSHREVTSSASLDTGLLFLDSIVDRRTAIVRELVSSERNYSRTMDIVHDTFYAPCESALAVNRAILSGHNVSLIFNDILQLRTLSRTFLSALKARASDWNAQQCIGDILLAFTRQLRSFTTFFQSYSTVLEAIERCIEQFPTFRAFLRRRERTPDSRMLTLPELFLVPSQRVSEYVTLVSALRHNTSPDHADINDLDAALKPLTSLLQVITQYKQRCQQERELLRIQKMIVNCPGLLEANRFYIKQIDVSQLKPPTDATIVPEMRVYQHIENLGLYLFNDTLVVTRRTSRHVPFERCVDHIYSFNTCVLLIRLEISDIADSKFVRNAFQLRTPKREWICSAENYTEKLDWVTTLEQAVKAAVARQ